MPKGRGRLVMPARYIKGRDWDECLHCYRATTYNERFRGFVCKLCERKLNAIAACIGAREEEGLVGDIPLV